MSQSSFFGSMDIASTAMSASRFQMDVISQNIANANTQNTMAGTPYRRQVAMIVQSEWRLRNFRIAAAPCCGFGK